MVTTYIGLGSNLGDRWATLRTAVGQLRTLGQVTAVSSLYETEPVGYRDQPWFLNAVVILETALEPQELLHRLLEIERAAGRRRLFPNAPRTLDLDLLLYDAVVMASEELVVPHPRLHERAFVLVPLVELAPDLIHPQFEVPMRVLLDALGERATEVRRLAGPEWVNEG
jgi:2-amino-4-hydroxy-6-hydroxymethyldihydropteridine diphosphokinase|uniref:2-amino-4-hydroxy-6-hydroxymethyldihydropteridine pyrophosphokinase n=1 Tax=Thermomicrobium roseum TaxID=500 RepID=A0A7C1G1Z8_THERO